MLHLLTAQGEVKSLDFKGLKLLTASLFKTVEYLDENWCIVASLNNVDQPPYSLVISKIVFIDLSQSAWECPRGDVLVHKSPGIAVLLQERPAMR